MGVKNVVKNHYPHPDRYFERRLFGEIEDRGFEYKPFNEIGCRHDPLSCREHREKYQSSRLGAGVVYSVHLLGGEPRRRDGFGPAWTGLRGAGSSSPPRHSPKTIGGLIDSEKIPLSDHDAITLEFVS